MKWNHETWSGPEAGSVTLVRAGEDGAVVVDGASRDVHEGDLFVHSGSDTVGVYSVNEDDLRNDGLTPDDGSEPADSNSDDDGDGGDADDGQKPTPQKRTVPRKRS